MKQFIALFTFFIAGLVSSSAQESQPAAKGGRTILIFDASGSMWGKIGNETKIEIARKTTLGLIKNRPAELEMGLMAYGHRRKGDCDDIEILVPPAIGNDKALAEAAKALTPRGKTPIYKSVLMAAESLAYTEEAASVILISDGIETCGGDLKALGKQLAEKGVDFKTHIIGFAMADEDTVQLRQLAKDTGGIYADASDAESLAKALKTAAEAAARPATTLTLVPLDQDGKSLLKNGVTFSVFRDKADETPALTGKGGQWSTELEPGAYHVTAQFGKLSLDAEVKVAKERDTTHTFTFAAPVLTLQAVMEEGGKPLEGSVTWTVLGAPDGEGKRAKVAHSYRAVAQLRLAPGKYLVTAKRGATSASKEVTFADQPQTLTLVLGAGRAKLTAVSKKGGPALKDGLAWRILAEPDAEGNRAKVASSYAAEATFTLPAGSYEVSLRKGNASTTAEIEIKPGRLTEATLVLGEGTLQPRLRMSADSAEATKGMGGVGWSVYSEENEEGKRTKAASGYGVGKKFTLPAGKYRLVAKRGNAQVSQDVEIKAGETSAPLLTLNASVLKPTAVMQAGGKAHEGGGLGWAVYSPENEEGKRRRIAHTYNAQPAFILPAGKYLLEVKRGQAVASQEITVDPGKVAKPQLNLDATMIRASVSMKEGAEASDGDGIGWSLFTPENAEGKRKRLSHTYNKQPTFWVPVGDYLLVVKRGSATAEQKIKAVGGKVNQFKLNLNAGVLAASLPDGATGKPRWDVLSKPDAEGKRKPHGTSYNKTHRWVLPEGEYLLTLKIDGKTVEKKVTIAPGKLHKETLNVE